MQRYLWIDLETTGLDPTTDFILEVGWIITDYKFEQATKVQSHVIVEPTGDALRTLAQNQFVFDMHRGTGLVDQLVVGRGYSLKHVEKWIMGDIARRTNEGDTWHLAGSSVGFDRGFIEKWMPELAAKLHHRILDVSSLRLLVIAAGLTVDELEIVNQHRAAADIEHSFAYASNLKDMLKNWGNSFDTRGTIPDQSWIEEL